MAGLGLAVLFYNIINNSKMKSITNIVVILTMFFFLACEDESFKEDNQRLGEQLAGEWNIVQVYFPANDSTAQAGGQAVFGSCASSCEGSFVIDDEVVNFSYNVSYSNNPDIPSQISMGLSNEEQVGGNNALKLQPSTFPIIEIDENNLTINLAFCSYDADSSCITTPRHMIMTR